MDEKKNEQADRPDGTADNLAPEEDVTTDPANTQLDADADLKREEDR